MSSLLESLAQSITPDVLGQISKVTGLDSSSTAKGLEIVGPILTGALANTASTPTGLDGLMGMLSQVGGTSTTDDLMKMVSGGGANSMLSGVFGSGLSAVTGTLERSLGFKVGPLLSIAAPFVLRQISQRMSGGGLSKAGIAKLLQDEQKTVASAGGATAQLVEQALTAGKEASATRGRYSSEQWKTLRLGPVATAGLVIGASPSGAAGIAKEVLALAETVSSLKSKSSPSSLFSLVTAEAVSADELNSLPTDPNAMLGLVKNSVASVSANNPIEGAAYGQFLVELATKVAEASKEGGFLGFGGTRVNDAEKAVIEQIKAAIGPGAGAAT